MSNLNHEKKTTFVVLIPFIVFVIFYLGLSILANDFYKVPMPIAFVIASATALAMNRKKPLNTKIDIYTQGMGNANIMLMCLIFILAGAFAKTADGLGSVKAAVTITQNFIPSQLMVVGLFIISAIISLAIGTSCGTIAALIPLAGGLAQELQLDTMLVFSAVIGGAMFGDNLSMISDTTIAATRTQNVDMKDKFWANSKIVIPVAILNIIIYLFHGNTTEFNNFSPISLKDILLVLPYLFILIFALMGINVLVLLLGGITFMVAISIIVNARSFVQATEIFWDSLGFMAQGITGMSETIIVAILAGGLLNTIRDNGGIDYIITKIDHMIKSPKACEFGILLLVSIVNLFTANNTIAIVIAGPIAKELSQKYGCSPKRIASILDTASCVVQGIIPYGAQILIVVGISKAMNIEISTFEIISTLYYPFLMLIALIIAISFKRNYSS